jgi:hypothetical protein
MVLAPAKVWENCWLLPSAKYKLKMVPFRVLSLDKKRPKFGRKKTSGETGLVDPFRV